MNPSPDGDKRLVDVTLDEGGVTRWNPEIDHERRVAIFDLLESNSFEPVGAGPGPYTLHLAVAENRLEMHVRAAGDGSALACVTLAMPTLRRVVRDYFTVCENYFEAIRSAPPSRIEALDMGRRAVHDEGARILETKLADRIRIDHHTARSLFTLICVLRVRGWGRSR